LRASLLFWERVGVWEHNGDVVRVGRRRRGGRNMGVVCPTHPP
jgi:hypothetical protein